jgi:hypothetical protein
MILEVLIFNMTLQAITERVSTSELTKFASRPSEKPLLGQKKLNQLKSRRKLTLDRAKRAKRL